MRVPPFVFFFPAAFLPAAWLLGPLLGLLLVWPLALLLALPPDLRLVLPPALRLGVGPVI